MRCAALIRLFARARPHAHAVLRVNYGKCPSVRLCRKLHMAAQVAGDPGLWLFPAVPVRAHPRVPCRFRRNLMPAHKARWPGLAGPQKLIDNLLHGPESILGVSAGALSVMHGHRPQGQQQRRSRSPRGVPGRVVGVACMAGMTIAVAPLSPVSVRLGRHAIVHRVAASVGAGGSDG